MLPNFLMVRFAHGSGGKFLCTILQTSQGVDHWEQVIQQHKTTAIFHRLTQEYVARKFPLDHKEHIRNEPMAPYNTDLYSSSYDRGQHISLDQYLDNARSKKDHRLLDAIESGLRINLIMNKPALPAFCADADSVVIVIDNQRSLEWLNKTLWSKHFLEKDDEIFYLPEHPQYCAFKSLASILHYNNPCQFSLEQKNTLWRKKISHNPNRERYLNAENFASDVGKVYLLPLSSFFSLAAFLDQMAEIFCFFDLGHPDLVLIESLHKTWLSRQIAF